jgi:HD-GYP domain-containing protein (c-di-GMP phosphodiesterase class II)
MSQQLIQYLEDNSLAILRDAMSEAREQAGPSLQTVSEDDLQVAMYTVLLKIVDSLRERSAVKPQTAPRDVKAFYLERVKEMMDYIDGQSTYTVGHTPAVVVYATQIAARLNLSDSQIDDIEYAAWIHNIGLLNQHPSLESIPKVLSGDELRAARNHTVVGAEMIRPIAFLAHLVPVVRYHHHPYDGSTGEPKGAAIPLGARIISIADAFRAMIEPRAYRDAMSRKDALLEIVKNSGKQFDPQLVPLVHELT